VAIYTRPVKAKQMNFCIRQQQENPHDKERCIYNQQRAPQIYKILDKYRHACNNYSSDFYHKERSFRGLIQSLLRQHLCAETEEDTEKLPEYRVTG
jgi:hypothetical protein